MKFFKKILLAFLAIFVIIQFFHPVRNEQKELLATDITKVKTLPDNVLKIIQRSCYDCHSNNTVYPWYQNIQPVAWFMSSHINDGKRHLNFSDFGSYDAAKQAKKLKHISEEVKEGGMPLSSYTLIHTDTKLSDAEKQLVITWADGLAAGN